MRVLTKKILLGISILGISCYAYATTDQTIVFKNQRGSEMRLQFHPAEQAQEAASGTLTGTFITAVGNCKEDVNVPVPLQGFYNGNAIAITINFPHCKQVVAMTGNINAGKDKISTIWLDASQASDPLHRDWNSNLIGTDFFTKESANLG